MMTNKGKKSELALGHLNQVVGGVNSDLCKGTAGDDTLRGGAGNSCIVAGAGNDVIADLGGNNYILAGAGDDTVTAWEGSDEIEGESGNDLIFAFGGNDTVNGGQGQDTLYGMGGNDVLDGDYGDDFVDGGDGDDTITVSDGADTLLGGQGNDTFTFNWQPTNATISLSGGGGTDQLLIEPFPPHLLWHFDTNGVLPRDLGNGVWDVSGLSGTLRVYDNFNCYDRVIEFDSLERIIWQDGVPPTVTFG